jgi:archaellum component FlaG (FlaF/FlaG flagellin family)
MPAGFGPDSQPIIGELIISPLNPQVITNPIAIADWLLKSLPTMAIVVGNTGAIAVPAKNTAVPVIHWDIGWRTKYVVPIIDREHTVVTVKGEMRQSTVVATIRPNNNPHAKPRESISSATALDIPVLIRNFGSQFHIPNSHAVYSNVTVDKRYRVGLLNKLLRTSILA